MTVFFDSNISDNHISDKSIGIQYFLHGHISDMATFPMWQLIYTKSGGAGGGIPLNHPEVVLAGVWGRQPLLGYTDNIIRLG
jgi:hypothetical protein